MAVLAWRQMYILPQVKACFLSSTWTQQVFLKKLRNSKSRGFLIILDGLCLLNFQERQDSGTSGFYQLHPLFSIGVRCPCLHKLQQAKLCCISFSVSPGRLVPSFFQIGPSLWLCWLPSNKSRENWFSHIFTWAWNSKTYSLSILIKLLFWGLTLLKA